MVAYTIDAEVQRTRITVRAILGIELTEFAAELVDADVSRAWIGIRTFNVLLAGAQNAWNGLMDTSE